jgi:hypothetical protein
VPTNTEVRIKPQKFAIQMVSNDGETK